MTVVVSVRGLVAAGLVRAGEELGIDNNPPQAPQEQRMDFAGLGLGRCSG